MIQLVISTTIDEVGFIYFWPTKKSKELTWVKVLNQVI